MCRLHHLMCEHVVKNKQYPEKLPSLLSYKSNWPLCLHHFIVKFDDGIPLQLLLLLSGDIQLNPHPSIAITSLHNVCTLEVADSHYALYCDMRDQWVHIACDPGIDGSTWWYGCTSYFRYVVLF